MNKVFPLSRWKKEKQVEHDAYSEEENSDEEESEYENIVIPKKNQAKRKRGPNKATINSRYQTKPKASALHPKENVATKQAITALNQRGYQSE